MVGLERETADTGAVAELKDVFFAAKSRNILELGMLLRYLSLFGLALAYDSPTGAGIGIVALTLAALRSSNNESRENISDRILTTDLGSYIPWIAASSI